jgi:hypothetical protein
LYTALLLAATTCLAADGDLVNPGSGRPYTSYYGGSYGGLEMGYNLPYAAAWAPWSGPVWLPWAGPCGSTNWGGYGGPGPRESCLVRLADRIHHRQGGAPPDRGNAAFSCDSGSFAGSGEPWSEGQGSVQGGAPDLGAPVVAPTGEPSPARAAGGGTE